MEDDAKENWHTYTQVLSEQRKWPAKETGNGSGQSPDCVVCCQAHNCMHYADQYDSQQRWETTAQPAKNSLQAANWLLLPAT
jgi:hypothetical protein